jgi:hypothetical protein
MATSLLVGLLILIRRDAFTWAGVLHALAGPPVVGTFLATLLIVVLCIVALQYQRVAHIQRVIHTYLPVSLYDNEYTRRLSHYRREKQVLGGTTVCDVFPELFAEASAASWASSHINIVIDSGTTMTALFPELLELDWRSLPHSFTYEIHTNNLAGVEELNLISGARGSPFLFPDHQVTLDLIGGHPYKMYRATLGEPTQRYIDGLAAARAEQRGAGRVDPIIAVVTGNWILGGEDLTDISLCARGKAHVDFKRSVVELADYVVVVAPLGKITSLREVEDLNRIAKDSDHPNDPYEVIQLPTDKRRALLVTTYRSEGSSSPLAMTAKRLQEIQALHLSHNYEAFEGNPPWDPPGDPQQVLEVDLPHRYMRRHASEAYSAAPE